MICITELVRPPFCHDTPEEPLPPRPVLPDSDSPAQDVAMLERQLVRVEPPTLWRVLLLNDDYTPMEFVVLVLQEFFGKEREAAVQIMLKVHHEGQGLCGVYTRDVAHTKVALVVQAAQEAGHPLQCVCEPAQSEDDAGGNGRSFT